MMFSLKLFGGASLAGETGAHTGPAAQRHRLALLALLATTHPGGLSRDKLMACLWPERDTEHARQLLNQAVYALRRALGEEAILSAGEELRFNACVVQCDVIDFEKALAAVELERAVAFYAGPFLDGFFLSDSPEFERWTVRERERLADAYARTLEALAEAAEAKGDFGRGVERWKARAAHDSYDSRVALRLMQALDASGNRAGALQHAVIHQRLLQEEFGMESPPEVRALAERLRREPAVRVEPSPEQLPSAMPTVSRSEMATVPTAEELPAPSPPVPSPPAPERPNRAIRYGIGALLLSAVVFGAIWLGPARSDPAPPAAQAASIAVLPFTNLSRDPEEEYFSDGLTEELTGVLSQVRALRVAARTSAFAFKGENRDIREIGEALNVGTVLEGSVRKEGDRVRVTAQLINVADGFHLWSETYEREVRDIFAIQSDLALRIARALEAELTPAEEERLARRPTENGEAYTLYLKGRYFWHRRTGGGLARAMEYFERAIEVDPQYAQAHAGLASVYAPLGVFGFVTPWEGRERMREAARKAVELDDGLAEAHTALAAYLFVYEWDWAAAEREYRRAIELDPSYPTGHMWYSVYLDCTGRFEEAVRAASEAVELDPLAPLTLVHLGGSLVYAGQSDVALEPLRTAIELDSAYWMAHNVLGRAHESRGELEEALRAYEEAAALAGPTSVPQASVARILARSARESEARRILEVLQSHAAETGVYAPMVASVFLALGDHDAALAWLEAAFQQRHPGFPLAVIEPGFASLRDYPRFRELLRRAGLRG